MVLTPRGQAAVGAGHVVTYGGAAPAKPCGPDAPRAGVKLAVRPAGDGVKKPVTRESAA